jgi:hypothetical protein
MTCVSGYLRSRENELQRRTCGRQVFAGPVTRGRGWQGEGEHQQNTRSGARVNLSEDGSLPASFRVPTGGLESNRESGEGRLWEVQSRFESGEGRLWEVQSRVESGEGSLREVKSRVESGAGSLREVKSRVESGEGRLWEVKSRVESGAGSLREVKSRDEMGEGSLPEARSRDDFRGEGPQELGFPCSSGSAGRPPTPQPPDHA